jgi:hypothetical protein
LSCCFYEGATSIATQQVIEIVVCLYSRAELFWGTLCELLFGFIPVDVRIQGFALVVDSV